MKKRDFLKLVMVGTASYAIGRYTMKTEMLLKLSKLVIELLDESKKKDEDDTL